MTSLFLFLHHTGVDEVFPVRFIDPDGMNPLVPRGADGLTNDQWIESSRPGADKNLVNEFREQNRLDEVEQRRKKREGIEDDPSELLDESVTYANGTIILNAFIAFQYQEGIGFVDLSFNPSITLQNYEDGVYVYNERDIAIRSILFERGSGPIQRHILRLEQSGIFVPLNSHDFRSWFYKVYGPDAIPETYVAGQYFGMIGDATSGMGTKQPSPAKFSKSIRRFDKDLKEAQGINSTRLPKNEWNKFLRANKGKFKGKYWMRDARKSYYNQKLNKS